MRKVSFTLLPTLLVTALVLALPLPNAAQNRERFVISAKAGGVNAVTGRASMRAHGNTEWQQLTIKEDLEAGDIVKTGTDGRVEMLLNPGSYLRVGENSEFELADNSVENLEVRLSRGTAIVEVTGADDEDLLIGITTPHTRMSIVRRGLYRVSVVPGDTTELIVRKGRVMLEGSHTKVKGGNKVVFSNTSFSVAKLNDADKRGNADLESWSKNRAQTLAKANSRLTRTQVNGFLARTREDFSLWGLWGRSGLWMYDPAIRCYTFLPFRYGWDSPYGVGYFSSVYGAQCCGRRRGYDSPGNGTRSPGGPPGSGGGTFGGPGASPVGPTSSQPPTPGRGKPDITNGPIRESRRDN